MYILRGKQISKGISIGKIHLYRKNRINIHKVQIENVAFEMRRFQEAQQLSVGQLKVLYEQAVQKVGQKDALIFGVHQMLIEDAEFSDAVCHMIEQDKVNVEYAVSVVGQTYATQLRGQGRSDDMHDIMERLLGNLMGEFETASDTVDECESMILVAETLMPSEMIRLKDRGVSGIVLKNSGQNSHTAILARTLEIPLLSCTEEELTHIHEGQIAVLDAVEGCLYLQASEELIQTMKEKVQQEKEKQSKMQTYSEQKTEIRLCANVSDLSDIERAKTCGADGIGLVRTEMLWLSKGILPTEEEQFKVYRTLAEQMCGKPVVIRTWDIGEDKAFEGFDLENRGIRMCLSHPELLKTQLRAICRASYYGKVKVLFPMITALQEVQQAKQMLYMVQKELEQEENPFDRHMEVGIMLETPAAMVLSRELAKEVEFCSVGTNDLIQYTFSVNRQDPSVDLMDDKYKTVILSMIQTAVEKVHEEGKKIGICGELGADETLISKFVKMGIDQLSVAPSMILNLRKRVLECENGVS